MKIRRSVVIVRRVTLIAGLALLLWIPLSFVYMVGMEFPFPRLAYLNLSCVSDTVKLLIVERFPFPSTHPLTVSFARVGWLQEAFGPSESTDMMLRPASFQCSRYAAPNGKFAATTIALPLWLLALLALLWPGAALISRYRRLRRIEKGLCAKCGYNLSGNTSGVCPECGTPVPQNTEATA